MNAPSPPLLTFFAPCPVGVADLLVAELRDLGALDLREQKTGVTFLGTLATGYAACLWSRTASRVLLQLAQVDAGTADRLYQGIQGIDWSGHLAADGTLAVDFSGGNAQISHTQFGALRVKDAIVDQFRSRLGMRPSVNLAAPDVRINVHLNRDQATVSIDLSGEPLHRRGYRVQGVAAPLKENLAAAILLRSGWPAIAAAGGTFVDPMCGSGSLPIEAACIAGDRAPGLLRQTFGFLHWRGHDAAVWQALREQAQARAATGTLAPGRITGLDQDPAAVRAAQANVERAGLTGLVTIGLAPLRTLDRAFAGPGLVATNPPYGERLGDARTLEALYGELGQVLRSHFGGWRAVVFTGNPPLARAIGIRARRSHTLFNGAIECRLLRFEVQPAYYDLPEHRPTREQRLAAARLRPGAQMFANRLAKNLKKLGDWARRAEVACFRVYDADMPEYAFAIDLYRGLDEGAEAAAVVQEYQAPDSVGRDAASARRLEALAVIPEVLCIDTAQMFVRTRQRQRDATQYQRLDDALHERVVREGPWRFLVNFTDHLDTGLFLDHRLTRQRIGSLASGQRFLNLFAYTGTATVYAAGNRAAATTTVDMSNTYLDWAQRNLALNRLTGPRHTFVRADVMQWIRDEGDRPRPPQFDLVFVDPPTFSRGKRMEETFEVQRDHVYLLNNVARLLAPGGMIVFSNNFTKFRLDRAGLSTFRIEDISAQTIPRDFERNPKIHCCFLLSSA